MANKDYKTSNTKQNTTRIAKQNALHKGLMHCMRVNEIKENPLRNAVKMFVYKGPGLQIFTIITTFVIQ